MEPCFNVDASIKTSVARFKTGKGKRDKLQVPISPLSIAGYVALAQRPLVIDDPYNAEQLASVHPPTSGLLDSSISQATFKTQNILCVPVINADVLMGVMQIINKNDSPFQRRRRRNCGQSCTNIRCKFRYD